MSENISDEKHLVLDISSMCNLYLLKDNDIDKFLENVKHRINIYESYYEYCKYFKIRNHHDKIVEICKKEHKNCHQLCAFFIAYHKEIF